jgi:hypothetical protein
VREKTAVFHLFEVVIRRIDNQTLRTKVDKGLYGEKSSGNEIIKYLIEVSRKAAMEPISGFT